MSGLRRILALYGGLTVRGDGGEARYVWDYENNIPTTVEEMPPCSERHAASERARWAQIEGKGRR